MTTLEALQSKIGVNYPNLENAALVALIENGLTGEELFTAQTIRQVDLSCAGLILTLVTSPNITEGGYSVSQGDKANLLNTRKIILNKYGISADDGSAGSIFNYSNVW